MFSTRQAQYAHNKDLFLRVTNQYSVFYLLHGLCLWYIFDYQSSRYDVTYIILNHSSAKV